MERNGDVVAEINACNSLNCALIGNCFNTAKYKMCKDDIVTPLFCSTPNHLKNGLIMDSQNLSPGHFLNSDENSIDLNFFSPRNGVHGEGHCIPIIERSNHSICDSPSWAKPPALKSFSPISKEIDKSYVPDSFLNGHKVVVAQNNKSSAETDSILLKALTSSNLSSLDEKLQLDYEAETSSSSYEDAFTSVKRRCESSAIPTHKSEANDAEHSQNPISPAIVNPTELDLKNREDSLVNGDRAMPELFPTLICLDDDSVSSEQDKKSYEVIDVAESPEMPTLIPFTSEVDEALRIKTEIVSDSESRHQDSDSKDSTEAVSQPQIRVERLSINDSLLASKGKLSAIFSTPINKCVKGPEIEEIEGVRFFQFHSKQDMEEFHKKSNLLITESLSMLNEIVPTKTFDITQIKGWRTKYFAPDCDFNPKSLAFDGTDPDENDQTEEYQNNDNYNNQQKRNSEVSNLKPSNTPLKSETNNAQKNPNDCSSSVSDQNDEKFDLKKVKIEKIDKISSPKSAFISSELDEYLSKSSELNISFLQKVNPNITPISPDAPILSIGKLRKKDGPTLPMSLIFKRKRELLTVEKSESDTLDSVISVPDTPESTASVTMLSSSETSSSSSSEEELLVSTLKSTPVLKKQNFINKAVKRKYLNKDLDQASKRVVLRLKKDSNGVSKGYKVSDISCKTENSESSCLSDVSLDSILIPEDGSLPIIKQTLFGKKNEPQLLEEFLNNLNMYGTRKDVAMLVQSNQSYFNEGPVLSPECCSEAMSVLVSNKGFMDLKQKSKKKLKTWQKYLPKKLSEKQILKIKGTRVRKTRIQCLLDDAESIISEERTKRAIRLPARYLDSAVLAAGTEWVSPLLHTADNPSLKKAKNESLESEGKTEPINVVELLSDDSAKESEQVIKQDESSSKISDTNALAETSVSPSPKTLLKRKKSTETFQKRKRSAIGAIKNQSAPSVADSEISTSSSCSSVNVSASYTVVPILPRCCGGHTARTSVYDILNKSFSCLKFDKLLSEETVAISKENGSKQEKTPAGTKTFVSKNNLECKKTKSMPQTGNISSNVSESMNPDLVKEECVSTVNRNNPESPITSLSTNVNTSSPSQMSSALQSSTPCNLEKADNLVLSKQENGLILVNESTNNMTNVSAAGVAGTNVIYFVVSPDQPTKKICLSSVPILPKTDLLKNKILSSNLKTKPAILTHKYVRESSSNVPCTDTSQSSANVNISQPSNVLCNNSATLRLSNLNQKHLLSLSKNRSPPTVSLVDKKDDPSNSLVNNASNTGSADPKKVVAAYKVGDNVFLYNTVFKSVAVSNASPKVVTNPQPQMPIITSIQSASNVVNNNENMQNYQLLPNGLKKCSVLGPKESNSTPASETKTETYQIQETPQGDHSYNKIKPKQKRKSRPISKQFCDSDEDEQFNDIKDNEDSEIDVETVDDSLKLDFQKKEDGESDFEVSDRECATIYKSSSEKISTMFSKCVSEKNRRIRMKAEFENLKASSESFQNAESMQEILDMAVAVIDTAKKKDKILTLARKRLKIHNTMLLEKLVKMLEGIEPLFTRNKIKTQMIKDIALDRQKSKNVKSPSLVSKHQKETPPTSSLGVEGDKLISAVPDMEMVQEEAKKKGSDEEEWNTIKPDFEIKLPYQDPYIEFDIQCHEKLDETTFITPPKKKKCECLPGNESSLAKRDSQAACVTQSKEATAITTVKSSASSAETNNQIELHSVPEKMISQTMVDSSRVSPQKAKAQSIGLDESNSTEALKLVSSTDDAKLQEDKVVDLTVSKEAVFQEGCSSLSNAKDQSSDVESSCSNNAVGPKSADPPPLTPKCYELKRLLQSRLTSKSLDNVVGEAETSSKSKNDDLKGAAGKLEICEMRKKVKSSLQKAVVETRKISESNSGTSESDSNSSSDSFVEKQLAKTQKTAIKAGLKKLQIAEMRMKVLNSLQQPNNSGQESSDSDTEALDSCVSTDSSDTASSVEICDDKSSKKPSTSKVSSENSTLANSNETHAQKSLNEESYPGLIPLFHPKVFQENLNKSSASLPSQSQSRNFRESSRQVPSLGSLSLQQTQKNLSRSANESKEEENDDIEIVGSKIVNPFSASAKVIRTINNSKEDQSKTSLGTNDYFSPCTVQKVQLKNGMTMFAYQPETTSLPLQTDAPASKSATVNKNTGQSQQQSPPEEIVLSDSEDENQEAVSKSALSNNEQVLPKSPLPQAPQTVDRPSNSGTVPQEQSDLSDSDDDRMHIDESCTNDAENL